MSVVKEYHDPLSDSQTSNEEGMLRDASPAVEFKSAPKMKEVFRETAESCNVWGKHQYLFFILNNGGIILDL